MMGQGVEVRIGPDTVIHLAAQKCPDWSLARLAKDVPARDLQPRKRPHDGKIGPLREARGIGAAEHEFNVLRVFTLHVPREDIFDHGAHRIGADGACVTFAPAGEAGIGRHFDQDPVTPPPAWRGGRGNDNI